MYCDGLWFDPIVHWRQSPQVSPLHYPSIEHFGLWCHGEWLYMHVNESNHVKLPYYWKKKMYTNNWLKESVYMVVGYLKKSRLIANIHWKIHLQINMKYMAPISLIRYLMYKKKISCHSACQYKL